MYDMAHHLRLSLKINVLVPEYPGFGIYRNSQCTSERILEDALQIFNYFTQADDEKDGAAVM